MVSQSEVQKRAQRSADALNRFVGALHAARSTAVMWAKEVENPARRIAAKYGLQLAFGHVVLTLRKFEDLWKFHLRVLLPVTKSRFSCEAIIDECKSRKLRNTANRLVAHYAPNPDDWPLGEAEIMELIRSNGWNTEEEVYSWVGELIPKIVMIRDDLTNCYGLTSLTEEKITA